MENNELYHWGFKAKYTGKAEIMYGGLFYEIEFLEGHLKGFKKWTQKKPLAI